jgi:hypothetical protein
MQTTIAPSFNLHLAARSHLSYSDRSTTPSSIVIKPRQYKQIVNLSISPFTNPCKVWFVEKGILVDKFLAHTIVADRGKEGSDIVNGQSPKDLDTIARPLAQAKSVIAKIIKSKSIALSLYCQGERNCSVTLSIVMRSLCFCAGESYITLPVDLCEGFPYA